MLDLELIRKNKAVVTRQVEERGVSGDKVGEVLKLDGEFRTELKSVEELRAKRNAAAKKRDVAAGQKLKAQLEKKEAALDEVSANLESKMMELPNLALPDVPVGSASKKKIIETFGKPKKFDFTPKDHLELGERLNIIDTQTAAKVSGSRFGYLKNEAALLELALVNFAMERLITEGFTPVIPPVLIKQEITGKLGYWQAGGNENYYLVSDFQGDLENPLYLIGTAEHAIVPMHRDDIIPAEELPRRYAAYSPAFRREAGTYGKDTRGIFRVHQFEKLEMVSLVTPEKDKEELNTLIDIPWQMVKELELPARKVILSSEDMSFPAAKTVDIEVWFPSQGTYRETNSIATTTDFQARRLNTRYIQGGKTGLVHILNGTAFAMQRMIVAILENYQRSDGSVEIPKILQDYTGFDEIRPS